MATVAQRVLENTAYILDHLSKLDQIELLTPKEEGRHAGIVTFRHRDEMPERLWQYLSEHGVACAQRGGGVRLSPHFYNKTSDLYNVIKLITEYRDDA
jgi:cysteine desulfurase/selenocysteine lyase